MRVTSPCSTAGRFAGANDYERETLTFIGQTGPWLVLCHRILILNKPPCGYTSRERCVLKCQRIRCRAYTWRERICLTRLVFCFLFFFPPSTPPRTEYFRLTSSSTQLSYFLLTGIDREACIRIGCQARTGSHNRFCDMWLVVFNRRVWEALKKTAWPYLRRRHSSPTWFRSRRLSEGSELELRLNECRSHVARLQSEMQWLSAAT